MELTLHIQNDVVRGEKRNAKSVYRLTYNAGTTPGANLHTGSMPYLQRVFKDFGDILRDVENVISAYEFPVGVKPNGYYTLDVTGSAGDMPSDAKNTSGEGETTL